MPIAVPLIAAGVGAAGNVYASNQASKGQKAAASVSQAATDQATAEQRRQYDLSRADNQPRLDLGNNALAQLGRMYGLNTSASAVTAPQTQGTEAIASQGFGGGGWGDRVSGKAMGMTDPNLMTMEGGASYGAGYDPSIQYSQPQQATGQTMPAVGQAAPVAQAGGQTGGQFDTFWQSPDYNFRQQEQARALTARNAALGIQDSGAAQKAAMQYSGNLASAEYNNYANRLAALAGVGQTAAAQNQSLGQNYAGAVGNLVTNNAANLGSSYQNQAAINGQLGQQLAGIGTGLLGQYFK